MCGLLETRRPIRGRPLPLEQVAAGNAEVAGASQREKRRLFCSYQMQA